MSQWTHVCGAIRVDGLLVKHTPAQEIIKQAMMEHVPEGSEGLLDVRFLYTGYEEDMSASMNIGTIAISGDLRDYDDVQEIFDWIGLLQSRLRQLRMLFRTVSVLVEVEYKDNHIIFVKMDDKYENILTMQKL